MIFQDKATLWAYIDVRVKIHIATARYHVTISGGYKITTLF